MRRVVATIVLLATLDCALANKPDSTLDEAFGRASLVVRGTVTQVRSTSFDDVRMYSFQSAEVEVTACLSVRTHVCSETPAKIGLVNPIGAGESYPLHTGREYMFLLNLSSFVIFAGGGAKSVLPIEDGQVDVAIFEGTPDKMAVSEFISAARDRIGQCAGPLCPRP